MSSKGNNHCCWTEIACANCSTYPSKLLKYVLLPFLSIFGDSESRYLSGITKWSSCFKSVWMGLEACQESWQDWCSFQSSSNVCHRKQGFKKTAPSFVVMWELSEQEQFIHFHFNGTAWFTVFAATFFHKFHLAALEERLKQCSLTQEKQNVGKLSPLFTSK